MALKKYLPLAFILVCFTNCDVQHKKSEMLHAGLVSSNDQTAVDLGCFDLQQESWFSAFHAYQAEGYSMVEADRLAVADAKVEFEACQKISKSNVAKKED